MKGRQSSLLEAGMGAALPGDADLSLGIQDQLKCGNKVRVLLSGPAASLLMASLLNDLIPQSRKRSSSPLSAFPEQPYANHRQERWAYNMPSGGVPINALQCPSMVGRCSNLPAAFVWPPLCLSRPECLPPALSSVITIAVSRGREARKDMGYYDTGLCVWKCIGRAAAK